MNDIEPGVLAQVAGELGAYVYMLVDPRGNRTPFYVGKGQRLRFDAHYREALVPAPDGGDDPATASRKRQRIASILADDCEPEVWILRHGLKKSEYTAVEAMAIDLLMSMPVPALPLAPLQASVQLTNARRERATGHGIRLLHSIIDEYAAPVLATSEPLLLITLNGEHPDPDTILLNGKKRAFAGYKPEWRESAIRVTAFEEIGESVRAWWNVSPAEVERHGIRHVVAVHESVTRALFEIDPTSWEPAPDRYTSNNRRITDYSFRVRTVRDGPLFDEVVGRHGHRLPFTSTQNSVRYWPLRSQRSVE